MKSTIYIETTIMNDNATVKEIRETRKRISARFGNDPKRLVDYYKEKQKKKRKKRQIICANLPAGDENHI